MMFDDVKKAVARFSIEELRQLREYIDGHEQQIMLHLGTVDMNSLLAALEDIREGLSEEDFADIERAMNDEYIKAEDAGH